MTRLLSSALVTTISLGLLAAGCGYETPSSASPDAASAGTGGNTPTSGTGGGGPDIPGTGGGGPDLPGTGGEPPTSGSGGGIGSAGSGGGIGTPGTGGTNVTGSGGAGTVGSGGTGTTGSGGAAGSVAATGGRVGTGGAPVTPTGGTGPLPQAYARPRLLIQTDGEIDDRSTMVRFLMYASDFDIVGIVQTNSRFQRSGHSKELWVERTINLYNQALPNLRIHNPKYPDASALMAVMRVGNENAADLTLAPSAMATKETPGSILMKELMLNDDPRPLHVATWGGANTLAYALYSLKATMPTRIAAAAAKLRIYCIWYQDNGGQWIEDNIPEAHIYEAYRWDNVWDYQSLTGPNPADVKAVMTTAWLNTNVKTNHGALGAYTPQTYVSEGDTPSFLTMIDNGLFQHVNYAWGGWGGRPAYDKGNHMTDQGVTSDDGDEYKPYWRWIPTLQHDFAARMDWAVADTFAKANHNPKAQVVGGIERDVTAGQMVTLDGSPTTDPDGNTMTFKWWQYYDADSAAAKVTIANSTAKTGATFMVPNEPGKQVHIIFEVTDNGTPPLTHYQRIVFNIK